MRKILKCKEMGVDCDFEVGGEEDILKQAAEHAKKDHGMEKIPPELLTKVKAAIHEE